MRKAVALLRAEEDSYETRDGLEKEEKEHPGPQAEGLPNRTWILGKEIDSNLQDSLILRFVCVQRELFRFCSIQGSYNFSE